MALKMDTLRLRLEFKNSDILSNAQKSQGLDKTWVLVPQPQTNFTTVEHLSAHIMHNFHLNQSCPHGLLLSMDGFALPPFVSISILKDKDVISVQKIEYMTGSDTTDKAKGHKIVATDCVSTGTLLLANEEFSKESGGYESEDSDEECADEHQEKEFEANDHIEDGNNIFKKRKASQKLEGSKKKKQRSEPRETVATENFREWEYIEIPYENQVPLKKKSKSKKGKSSKNENQTTGEANNKLDDETQKDVKSASNLKINEHFQDGEDVDGATNVPGSTKKGPSRSSRRQYEKRIMLREMKKVWAKEEDSTSKKVKNSKRQNKAEKRVGRDLLQNEGLDQPKGLLHLKQFSGKDISKAYSKPEEDNQNRKSHGNTNKGVDTSNEFVRTKIRSGHIRFEALEEDQEGQVSTGTFEWNGITSKKKGQKWGTEKGSASRKNDSDAKEAKLENIRASEWMYFANLPTFPGIPKEGDVIAYRLIQLSSSWTPEISSYRVGKVSSYNSQSCKILLKPVPEYPIVSKKSEDEESTSQEDDNIYSKDGSLEIDFTSLVDIRTVKNNHVDPSASKEIVKHGDGVPLCNGNVGTSMSLGGNEKSTGSMVEGNCGPNQGNSAQAPSTPENVDDPWEKLSEALNPKKEEVPKEISWGKITTDSKKEDVSKQSCWGKIPTNSSWGKITPDSSWGKITSDSSWGKIATESRWGKITTDSKDSGWGKIATPNSNRSYNPNGNNGSYGAFRGSTVRPPMSNRGRGGRGRVNGRNCWRRQ